MATDEARAALREKVAKAMRDVYLSRQPKQYDMGCYPLEEFLPEADAAIDIVLEEAARVAIASNYYGGHSIARTIRGMKGFSTALQMSRVDNPEG